MNTKRTKLTKRTRRRQRQTALWPSPKYDHFEHVVRAPGTHTMDGVDLTAILSGKTLSRGKPVLSTYGRGNHSLRNEQFCYIRYRNGAEEFYDELKDPYEWHNLANNPNYLAAKEDLRKWLPHIEALDIAKPLPPLLHATWSDEAFTE